MHLGNLRLQVFLPELAVLQADPAASVRKFLPEFLEACPLVALQPATLLLVLQCLQGLLQDSVPAVVKAAVMASSTLFRTALAVVVGQVCQYQYANSRFKRLSEWLLDASQTLVFWLLLCGGLLSACLCALGLVCGSELLTKSTISLAQAVAPGLYIHWVFGTIEQ